MYFGASALKILQGFLLLTMKAYRPSSTRTVILLLAIYLRIYEFSNACLMC